MFQVKHVIRHNIHINVNRSGVILVLQIQWNKRIGVFNAIHKVTASLYHTLVNQLWKGSSLYRYAQVEQELIPETRVDEVTGGVPFRPRISLHSANNRLPADRPNKNGCADPCNANSMPMIRQSPAWYLTPAGKWWCDLSCQLRLQSG